MKAKSNLVEVTVKSMQTIEVEIIFVEAAAISPFLPFSLYSLLLI